MLWLAQDNDECYVFFASLFFASPEYTREELYHIVIGM